VPRFLCDEMLHGLGRWLRAAGYDTVIAKGGIPDRELARRCAGEDRILLTKDRHLAATAAGIAPVVLVKGKSIDETARALRTALDIEWQHAPFSRCIVDNRPLEPAPPYLAMEVPERSRAAGGPLRDVPRMRPPLLVGRPCPSNATAAGCVATGSDRAQLTSPFGCGRSAWQREVSDTNAWLRSLLGRSRLQHSGEPRLPRGFACLGQVQLNRSRLHQTVE
jgi:uncharacterized protein